MLVIVMMLVGVSHQSCEQLGIDVPKTKTVTGTWALGAGNDAPGSFRNFRYTFTINKDNGNLDITLESKDTDVSLWLYNPLGQLIHQVWGGRVRSVQSTNLKQGQYVVIAGTYVRGEKGSFSLTVKGTDSNLNLVNSETRIFTEEWKTNGGGNDASISYRNHHYTLDVTEDNSVLDVNLESANTDVSLWIFNPLGQRVGQVWGGRTRYMVADASKGRYLIVAGTNGRGVRNGSYTVNFNGQFTNLQRVASQDISTTGSIVSGGGNNDASSPKHDVYTLDVTDDNGSLDIVMESADFDGTFWLFNPLGQFVGQRWGSRSLTMITSTVKGKYTLVCGTNNIGSAGRYNLSVVGKFQNFAKK